MVCQFKLSYLYDSSYLLGNLEIWQFKLSNLNDFTLSTQNTFAFPLTQTNRTLLSYFCTLETGYSMSVCLTFNLSYNNICTMLKYMYKPDVIICDYCLLEHINHARYPSRSVHFPIAFISDPQISITIKYALLLLSLSSSISDQ